MSPKIVLVNDTSMFNAHFGTQLVGQTFREQLARLGCELIGAVGQRFGDCHALFSRADLLVINGEGSIHHGRNLHLVELAKRYPCVLINCVWEENPAHEALGLMKTITVRESYSAALLESQGFRCRIVPDVSFASMLLRAHQRPGPTADLGYTDNVRDRESGFTPFAPTPHAYLNELSRYRRLCIGRFHAAVAASVLRIPFSTWPSNTFKIEGMMQDMGVLHLHRETREEAAAICPSELDARIAAYADAARLRVMALFDEIARIAAHRSA